MQYKSLLDDIPGFLDKFDSVQGMMSRLSGASFISILKHQEAENNIGDIVEFGVYKGKSAFLLAHFINPPENLVLVDTRILSEVSEIKKIAPGVRIFETSSKKFSESRKMSGDLHKKVRFLHIDGNHTFDNVAEDMEIAEKLVTDDGLVVLDDFLNPNYPQVQAATYRHLYTKNSRFAVFLIGGNKAFLCNKKNHNRWLNYAVSGFADDMEHTGHRVVLARTDSNPLFDAVYFRGRKPDEEVIYGAQLYSRFFPKR